MIPQIKEIEGKFPEYATLSTATATLVDMGDKTITAQVKIDGSIVPDFSYDWEIEFQGEKYIHPLREPQASKSNESIRSQIDLVFQHWATYQLKRYFFTQIEVLDSGTLMANNYIYPIGLTLNDFVVALANNLDYYFNRQIVVQLNPNPETPYMEDKVEWSFNYTHLWDALTQMPDKYNVRWGWDYEADTNVYYIRIGYPAKDISHIFEYGYEKGLTKIERQVQDTEIRNQMFGRGGSQNLPYRYFKKPDPNNTAWQEDPDWIPELASIYFSELRGKTFRDYVRGWKAKHYGGKPMQEPTEAYTKGYTDAKFNPIEYVEDKESIAKYGIIQGGLDNNEEIFPTIQKRDLGNGLGRADEVVDVETILVDEPTSNMSSEVRVISINDLNLEETSSVNKPRTWHFMSSTYQVPSGCAGYIVKDFKFSAIESVTVSDQYRRFRPEGGTETFETRKESVKHPLTLSASNIRVKNTDGEEIENIVNIPEGTAFFIEADIEVSNFLEEYTYEKNNYPFYGQSTTVIRTPYDTCGVRISLDTEVNLTPIHGLIIGNYIDGVNRIKGVCTVAPNGASRLVLESEIFEIDEDGSTNVDVPIRITSTDESNSFSYRTTINAIDQNTKEVLDYSNLPEGKYCFRVLVDITNLTSSAQSYTVELLPAYIYYPYDSAKWRPTFDIWIKDIWGSTRLEDENDTSYAERVWRPILGDRQGNEAKVVFSSGLLSGHSDYEFPIVAFAYDNSKSLDGVSSHWRLTLGKSDAEVDASGKWLPSIQTQAHAGDYFYFIGIDMPHQYVLWAEEEVDKWKRENMPSSITPTWTISLDKVRINTQEYNDTALLFSQLNAGSVANFRDKRFTKGVIERRYIQSMTITWNEGRLVPDTEIVLSDKKPARKSNILTDIRDIKVDIVSVKEKTNKDYITVSKDTKKASNASEQASNEAKKASVGLTEVKREVLTLDYVKKVVKKDETYDTETASLGSLISVRDANTSALQAGLYGGGVDAIDTIGGKNAEHGNLVVFAGTQSDTDLSTSKFRVYGDGTLYASNGVFGGVLKKSKTEVTPNNISNYLIARPNKSPYIDILKVGSFVEFNGFSDTWVSGMTQTEITLPHYDYYTRFASGSMLIDDMLALIGNRVVIKLTNSDTEQLCFSIPLLEDDGFIGMVCAVDNTLILTCEARYDTNGNLNIGWINGTNA